MNPEIKAALERVERLVDKRRDAEVEHLRTAVALLAREVEDQGRLVAMLTHGVRRPDAPAPASPHSAEVAAPAERRRRGGDGGEEVTA